ncbi:response regulator transcription factor [Ureibacillus thermosphaericus]|uniref:response regulator transcription factor n=1 Tax=Ureibacillus thermosphaericus TaxID=51173 RepID=UPI000BBC2780|nr:response regulator transcription factor [Ureibacillus thermosphaericus]
MILDDHIAVGEGTRTILESELDCHAEVFTNARAALEHVKSTTYDIYLIDFNLSEMDGLEFLEKLLNIDPKAKAIIYTGYSIEKYMPDLIKKGISGFISKSDSRKQLIDTIHYALDGKVIISIPILNKILNNTEQRNSNPLTDREIKILDMVKNGMTNKGIARELHLSQRTIEKDLTSIFIKLDVGSRAEAVIKWNELLEKEI